MSSVTSAMWSWRRRSTCRPDRLRIGRAAGGPIGWKAVRGTTGGVAWVSGKRCSRTCRYHVRRGSRSRRQGVASATLVGWHLPRNLQNKLPRRGGSRRGVLTSEQLLRGIARCPRGQLCRILPNTSYCLWTRWIHAVPSPPHVPPRRKWAPCTVRHRAPTWGFLPPDARLLLVRKGLPPGANPRCPRLETRPRRCTWTLEWVTRVAAPPQTRCPRCR